MAADEWWFTESGPSKEAAVAAAEALARKHYGDTEMPECTEVRVLAAGQVDDRQQLVGPDATWTVQLVYPAVDGLQAP